MRISHLRRHCVSRPVLEDFARFFNHHSNLQPHCVSRRRPVNSPQGRRPRRLVRDLKPPTKPILPVVVRMAPSPTGTRPPVALALTTGE
jgi:hypothetical protein